MWNEFYKTLFPCIKIIIAQEHVIFFLNGENQQYFTYFQFADVFIFGFRTIA